MIDPFSPQFCVHIVWLTNLETFGRRIAQEQSESRYLLKLDFLDIIGIVQEAQEAIPPDIEYIDRQYSVLQRYKIQIHGLQGGPDRPVSPEGFPIRLFQLLPRITSFHQGHAREEDADHGRSTD